MKNQKDRIEELSQLKDGWNGGGAYAIIDSILDLCRSIVEHLDKWHIFPDTNGTILLQLDSNSRSANISIGVVESSFVAISIDDGRVKCLDSGYFPTTEKDIVEKIKQIEELVYGQ